MTPASLAATLLGLEGAAALVTAVAFAVGALAGHPAHRGVALALVGLLALTGVAIGLVARGVRRRRQWARTPSYLVQFFALIVAWYQRDTLIAVAVVVAAVALATVAALSRAMHGTRGGDPGGG